MTWRCLCWHVELFSFKTLISGCSTGTSEQAARPRPRTLLHEQNVIRCVPIACGHTTSGSLHSLRHRWDHKSEMWVKFPLQLPGQRRRNEGHRQPPPGVLHTFSTVPAPTIRSCTRRINRTVHDHFRRICGQQLTLALLHRRVVGRGAYSTFVGTVTSCPHRRSWWLHTELVRAAHRRSRINIGDRMGHEHTPCVRRHVRVGRPTSSQRGPRRRDGEGRRHVGHGCGGSAAAPVVVCVHSGGGGASGTLHALVPGAATGGAGDGRHAVCQARRLVPGAASGSARAGCAQRLRPRAAPLAGAPAPVLGAAALVVGVWRSGQRFEWQECEVRGAHWRSAARW